MPKICYTPKEFTQTRMAVVTKAVAILNEYAAQGYDLTLRQLYYQFVSRGYIPNKDTEYKKLGEIIGEARMAGLIDWDHIVDRTRNLRKNASWASPEDILGVCARQFQIDKWDRQPNYVEVWIEKDALVGVLDVACVPLDVPYFSCRGYTSLSEMWTAGQRLLKKMLEGKQVTILHLGDHDPSGIDMSRDIEGRLRHFMQHHVMQYLFKRHPGDLNSQEHIEKLWGLTRDKMDTFTVDRIALNMDQVRRYDPPPNPAKVTDSRATQYIEEYGEESWELDALEPAVLTALIEDRVGALRDEGLWDEALEEENHHKEALSLCASRWEEVTGYLNNPGRLDG